MADFNESMKSVVLEYITNHSGKVDYVDINHHFKIHAARVAVAALEDEEKVRKVWNGRYYLFEAI